MDIVDIAIAKKLAGSGGGGGGSSDFSTAEVTFNSLDEYGGLVLFPLPCVDFESNETFVGGRLVDYDESKYTCILYKNKATVSLTRDYVTLGDMVSVEGNATYDVDNTVLTITGDCVVTIASSS